jgi:hypothetical protein
VRHRGGLLANLPLQTESAFREDGRSLERKTEGVHIQLLCGLSRIHGGEILGEGTGAAWLFDVIAEEQELHTRHGEPVRGWDQFKQKTDVGLVMRCLREGNGKAQ